MIEALLALALATAEPDVVPMDRMVAQGLAKAPGIVAARATIAAQVSRTSQARGAYWPQIGASAGISQTTEVSAAQTVNAAFPLGNARMSLRQNLYDFGKIDASVASALAGADTARQQAVLTTVELAYSIRAAYLAWAQADGLEAQVRQQQTFAAATLAQAKARFKSGVAARLEVTRAETAVAQALAARAAAKSNTMQARRNLAATIGETTLVPGSPAFPPEPPIAHRPLAELERAAIQHPAMALAGAQREQAVVARDVAERSRRPDLSADASYGVRARDQVVTPNYTAGVNLNWPWFSGFADVHQAEAAQQLLLVSDATLAARRLDALRDVDNAHTALIGARERVPAATAAMNSANANLQQAQGRYRAGVGAILEVADAQSLVATARADWVRATTAYHLAIADLQRAIGDTGAP